MKKYMMTNNGSELELRQFLGGCKQVNRKLRVYLKNCASHPPSEFVKLSFKERFVFKKELNPADFGIWTHKPAQQDERTIFFNFQLNFINVCFSRPSLISSTAKIIKFFRVYVHSFEFVVLMLGDIQGYTEYCF